LWVGHDRFAPSGHLQSQAQVQSAPARQARQQRMPAPRYLLHCHRYMTVLLQAQAGREPSSLAGLRLHDSLSHTQNV
jgi:hypothetical protein